MYLRVSKQNNMKPELLITEREAEESVLIIDKSTVPNSNYQYGFWCLSDNILIDKQTLCIFKLKSLKQKP